MLSKALDNDPSSVVLWFVYLLIYYGNLKPNEKDDMFLSAVCSSLLLLLCGVCPGEYFFLLKGKWGVFENFVIVDKLRKSTETL